MSSMRDHILEVTCELLEAQGYYATGLNQILTESGAPKGSLYYYFPQGKEELTEEAIKRTGQIIAQRIQSGLATIEDLAEAIRVFMHTVAHYVETSKYRSGGPLTTVALETVTSSERLNMACREAYQLVQQAFAEKFVESGYSQVQASQLATFVTASIEGGIMLSRTNHSGEPLRRVADTLGQLLNHLPKE